MWNVTDEVPKNSEMFVTCGGIDIFLKCKKRFRAGKKYGEDVGKVGRNTNNEECSDDKRNFTKPEHIRVCQKLTVE